MVLDFYKYLSGISKPFVKSASTYNCTMTFFSVKRYRKLLVDKGLI